MGEVFIGLGSNLGNRMRNIGYALQEIEALPDTRVVRVSEVVESEPWGVADQPYFANSVALIETALHTDGLLSALKHIETRLGREPGERNGPRLIDLDILLAGDEHWDTPELVVPHPRLAERQFALWPLLEIAPDAAWPNGTAFDPVHASEGRIVGRLGAVPGFEGRTAGASRG